MAKRIGIIAALCCILALSFSLVGCGGNVDKSNYTGEWKLTSGSDENLDAESIALMESLGLSVTMTLNEDGTGSLNLFGEAVDLTWEASSNTEGTMTLDGSKAKLLLEEGALTIEDATGTTMTFNRAS